MLVRNVFFLLIASSTLIGLVTWNDLNATIFQLPSGTVEYYMAFVAPSVSRSSQPHVAQADSGVVTPTRTRIAYAISITKFGNTKMFDQAAVLHKSIALASEKSHYDYHMIAFVHPDAINCKLGMERLGYEVQVRETPFNETGVRNEALRYMQKNSCCGFSEYLKLYVYTLLEYPAVVHLDMDTIVLKPLDDLFDLMLDESFDRTKIPAMWQVPEEFPSSVDFMFTRDYYMVKPGRRQPHQIGVQGGFLVVRPNTTDFERMVEIILEGGNFTPGVGWGGEKGRYGGYFGAATIQGLASYYYGEFEKERSLELNRCYYNTMVDDPYNSDRVREDPETKLMCRTLESECEDCRKTPLEDIYTAHFTVCGKPTWCADPKRWHHSHMEEYYDLCMKLFREWHLVRRAMEDEWRVKYPAYDPGHFATESVDMVNYEFGHMLNSTFGHCKDQGRDGYIQMMFPSLNTTNHWTEALIG